MRFYESVEYYLNEFLLKKINILDDNQAPNNYEDILKAIFLLKEEKMIEFFDKTEHLWTEKNDKKTIT